MLSFHSVMFYIKISILSLHARTYFSFVLYSWESVNSFRFFSELCIVELCISQPDRAADYLLLDTETDNITEKVSKEEVTVSKEETLSIKLGL